MYLYCRVVCRYDWWDERNSHDTKLLHCIFIVFLHKGTNARRVLRSRSRYCWTVATKTVPF